MTNRYLLGALAVLSVTFFPGKARAACSLCTCTVTATGVSFGTYNGLSSANNDATGSVQVTCNLLVAVGGSYTIDLSTGNSNAYSQRTMSSGASTLGYNLYADSARQQVWGNGSAGSVNVTNTFLALLFVQQTASIYGRITGSQNVASGTYTDTIVVTVTY